MLTSSTLQNNKFTHVTTKLNMINMRLVSARGIPDDDIEKIQKLQNLKTYHYDIIEILDDKFEIRTVSYIITQIDFQLQKLWKFELDETKHRWFELPKCSCPKMDNLDNLGTPYKIINPDCIIHGE